MATFTVSDSWTDQGTISGTVTFFTAAGNATVASITNSALSATLHVGVQYAAVFTHITWNGWPAAIQPIGFVGETTETVSLRALGGLSATLSYPFQPPAQVQAGGAGSVTSVAVEPANGFTGSVANATSTPQITIKTSVTGLLIGDGTAVSAATSGEDYMDPGPPVVVDPDGDYPVTLGDESNGSNIAWRHPSAFVDGRLNQRANGEIVWSANVNNADTMDDSTQPAAKFGMDMANALMTFQNSAAGNTSWSGSANAEIDMATGDWTFNHNVTVDGTLTFGGAAPGTSTDAGSPGQIAYDSLYLYLCVATDTWKRVALTTF